MAKRVFKIRYQMPWMRRENKNWFKEYFLHATTEAEAGGKFGVQHLDKGSDYFILSSTIQEEIVNIIKENTHINDYREEIEGIDNNLVETIMTAINDLNGD